jgi:UDP-N-acetylmuramate dehydrogenase
MGGLADETVANLSRLSGVTITEDVPFSEITTWKVGGPARLLVDVESAPALKGILLRLADPAVRLMVLGNGSDVLVSDEGFDGVVLRLRGDLSAVAVDGDILKAGAGAMLGSATVLAGRESLSGLEFALGIPGTVGGAIMTNAGAFDGDVASVVERVDALTREGETRTFTEFEGGYRMPLVPESSIVTAATLRLRKDSSDSIKSRMKDARMKREGSQPLGEATAGSVFKNPRGESAGRLIDACDLKGSSIGGAAVSRVHANFIVNEGGASAGDILKLMERITSEVESRFGVRLEPEVRLVGFDKEN